MVALLEPIANIGRGALSDPHQVAWIGPVTVHFLMQPRWLAP
jgi:hypothetical protein